MYINIIKIDIVKYNIYINNINKIYIQNKSRNIHYIINKLRIQNELYPINI